MRPWYLTTWAKTALGLSVWACCLPTSIADEAAPIALNPPLSPDESLAQFRLAAGLRLEIAASEPEVVDPVAVRFDERGRMWVVEMCDYPDVPPPGHPPLSRVKWLEDRDGDGRYETAHLFADELLFATGVQPWRGGAIVTLSGRIEWMLDTDGDGRADHRETWYTGFVEENPQLRANRPRFALDNHVYVANGLRGGNVTNQRAGGSEAVSISGRDFRFEPLSGTCQAVTGNGQFGLTFDDYGNRFTCNNRHPLVHVVLAEPYLARNRLLAVPTAVEDVAAAEDLSRVFPLSEAWTTSILHAGQFTAACGVEIYRGDALPGEFYGNAFICEPTGNLVHREVIEPAGASFRSHPAEEGVEFLASPDPWFRPVNLETGPDGALYVVDMYRAVIEHPQWVPDELKERPDLRYGDDRGRVYRIVAAASAARAARPNLADASAAELVAALAHPNSWRRETAARLLYQRQERSALPALEELAVHGAGPRARVQALWSLRGLDGLSNALLLAALADPHPRVREQAALLAEPSLSKSSELLRRVVELAGDADARVRFQAALSLGAAPDQSIAALTTIALAGADDPWTRRAVETAVPDEPGRLLAAVLAAPEIEDQLSGRLALVAELAQLSGARRRTDDVAAAVAALNRLTDGVIARRLRWAAVAGLAGGLESRGVVLGEFLPSLPDVEAGRVVHEVVDSAIAAVSDEPADTNLRIEACGVLPYAEYGQAAPVLTALIEREPSQDLRLRAVRALAAHHDPDVGRVLIRFLPQQTPAIRGVALDALLATADRTMQLLDAMAAGEIRASELDPLRAGRLVNHSDATIRARAGKLLAASLPADHAEVLAAYRDALELKAEPRHGREVFAKNCTACHRIGKLGVDVAPSIADSRTKTQEQLLVDILQPSKAIDNNYVSYTVLTSDGQSLVGVIAAETPTSVTLKLPEGKVATLLRGEIDELRSNGVSLMPDGLERAIGKQDMADLISYIKNWRYLEGNVPARAGK